MKRFTRRTMPLLLCALIMISSMPIHAEQVMETVFYADEEAIAANEETEATSEPIPVLHKTVSEERILPEDAFILGIGQSKTLKTASGLAFRSTDAEIVVVSAKGVVTAKAVGEAVLVVESDGLETERCKVIVEEAPTKVSVANAIQMMYITQATSTLDVTCFAGEKAVHTEVSFKSSAPSVIAVDPQTGAMTAKKAGSATITVATYKSRVKTTFKVTVKAAPSKVTLSPKQASIAIGQTGRMNVTFPKNTLSSITYSAMPEGIVRIESDGTLVPLTPGMVTVRAQAHNGVYDEAVIEVLPEPREILLSFDNSAIGEGAQGKVSARTDVNSSVPFQFEYFTTTPEYIQIDANTGAIVARKEGVAQVGARLAAYDIAAMRELDILPGPDRIVPNHGQMRMMVGNAVVLPYALVRDDGRSCDADVVLKSSNAKVVSIEGTTLRALKAGNSTITISASHCESVAVQVTVYAKPTKITLSASSIDLDVGDTCTLPVRVFYSSKNYLDYAEGDGEGVAQFFSSDPDIADVAVDGTITAYQKGECTITVQSGKKTASCKITVWSKPTEIGLFPQNADLGVGMTRSAQVSFQPFERSGITYESSAPDVAHVSASGIITAMSVGKAYITATSENGVSAKAEVRVLPAPDAIVLKREVYTMLAGNEKALPVTFSRADGAPCMGEYSVRSSNPKVLNVKGTTIKALKAGKATLTVSSIGCADRTVQVTVCAKANKIQLSTDKEDLDIGDTYPLQTKVYYSSKKYVMFAEGDGTGVARFESSDTNVATIDENGLIRAIACGDAVITVRSGAKSAKCVVHVWAEPTSIALLPQEQTLGIGMTDALQPLFNDGEHSRVQYASQSPDVAAVSEDGAVLGKAPGSAILTCTTSNGKRATAEYTIIEGPDTLRLEQPRTVLPIKQSTAIVPVASRTDGAPCLTSYRYTTSDSKVATVNENGIVSGIAAGTATITVETANGLATTCEITVCKAPSKVSFGVSTLNLVIGQCLAVPVKITADSTFLWDPSDIVLGRISSSNADIVSVETDTGMLVAHKVGKAKITYRAYNGKTATLNVSVSAGPTELDLRYPSVSLTEGDEYSGALDQSGGNPADVEYRIEDLSIATILRGDRTSYRLRALSAGTTLLTAVATNGAQATQEIRVYHKPEWLRFESESPILGVGQTAERPSAQIFSSLGECDPEIRYSVEGDCVLLSGGKLIADKVGTSLLIAEGAAGFRDTLEIKVVEAPTELSVTAQTSVLQIDQSTPLRIEPSFAANGATFSVSDESVLRVDASGNVTAMGGGTATIKVTAYNGAIGTIQFDVPLQPQKLRFDNQTMRLRVGEECDVSYTIDCGDRTQVRLFSQSEDIVEITAQGTVKAKCAGTARILAEAEQNPSVFDAMEILVEEDVVRIGVGQTCFIDGVALDFASADEAIAIVNADASVTGIAPGCTELCSEGERLTLQVMEAPTVLNFGTDALTLCEGEEYALRPNGTELSMEYTSSVPDVIAMDKNGLLHALRPGETTVTARTYNGCETSVSVRVIAAPRFLGFACESPLRIAIGESIQLEGLLYTDDGCAASVDCTVYDESVVSLTGNAIIAHMPGTTVLRAKTPNGRIAYLTVEVVDLPEMLAFGENPFVLGVGETAVPQVFGDNGARINVAFASSDEEVLSVDSDGSICALREGTATLTAYSLTDPTIRGEATVVCAALPNSILFGNDEIRIGVGEMYALQPLFEDGSYARNCALIAENPQILATSGCMLYGLEAGETHVAVRLSNGIKSSVSVRVMNAPTRLMLSPDVMSGCAGDGLLMHASFPEGEYAGNITYTSSDATVATVDANGYVSLSAMGEASITAIAYNGVRASASVRVTEMPQAMSFSSPEYAMLVDCPGTPPIEFDRGCAMFALRVEDETIASIAEDGKTVVPIAPGFTELIAEAPGCGLEARCTIVVSDQIDFALVADRENIETEETLTVRLLPENFLANGIAFRSMNEALATVDAESGCVTGIAYGTAQIEAFLFGECLASANVQVLGGKRRLLITYNWATSGDSNYLPFAQNDAQSVCEAFTSAMVEGQKYQITGPAKNPGGTRILQLIQSTFSEADDNDVSVLYIVTHGSEYGVRGEYSLHLAPNDYVSAHELIQAIRRIRGRVVLILVTCNSGGVIDFTRGILNAQDGRISILTSSGYDTNSSYWTASTAAGSVDFYTYSLLYALGYNASSGSGCIKPSKAHGFSLGGLQCDANNDGKVSLQEIHNYAKAKTMYGVSHMAGEKNAKIAPGQTPQAYIGWQCEDLLLF